MNITQYIYMKYKRNNYNNKYLLSILLKSIQAYDIIK